MQSVDANMYFHWSNGTPPPITEVAPLAILDSLPSPEFLITSEGDSISMVTFPVGFGDATNIQLIFDTFAMTVPVADAFDFTHFVPDGVHSFLIQGVDGMLGNDLLFGLQFRDGTLATVGAGIVVPEPSSLALASCAAIGCLMICGRRRRAAFLAIVRRRNANLRFDSLHR